jgi:predicted transcriptional regulator
VHIASTSVGSADQGGSAKPDQNFRLAWLRKVAADRRLVGYSARVAIAICGHAGAVKQTTIAAELGITTRTVRAAAALLIERGYIEIARKRPASYRIGGRHHG